MTGGAPPILPSDRVMLAVLDEGSSGDGGLDNSSNLVIPGKVPIVATAPSAELPTVFLIAGDPETSEPAPNIRVRPGSVNLHRSGDARDALRVYVQYEGTATYGIDYAEAPQWVEFPAGVISVQVLIAPMEDDLVEGDEVVSVELIEPPIDSLPTYRIDLEWARAKIVIHDRQGGAVLKLRRIGGASLDIHGAVRLDILGPINQLVTVDVSDDLKTWVELKPVLLQGDGAGSGEDLNADKSNHRFYRVRLLPMKY